MEAYDIVIIGGGPAGLAAAVSAREHGAKKIMILERDKELGGVLNQCIHNGFGLHRFKEELTGPEYAQRYIDQVISLEIPYLLHTMVLDISKDRIVTAINKEQGLFHIKAGAVILAMGCRERPRGALNIPGYRPAGIFSAGTAQRLVNMEGFLPGKEIVILGSGDIGLIMARRLTLEGCKVKVVAEIMPYSGGLKRNIVQCLDDYNIPLKLSHTVVDIDGKDRICGVTIAKVDEHLRPIKGTEEYISCDTLLLSVGLIPENELSSGMGVVIDPVTKGPVVNESLETSIKGVFACGNVLHVHDLVDYVSEEAKNAGEHAAEYVQNLHCIGNGDNEEYQKDYMHQSGEAEEPVIELHATDGVRYTVPKYIHPADMAETMTVRFRVGNVYRNSYLSVYYDDKRVVHRKKLIMTPGEMEEIILQKSKLTAQEHLKNITIRIEEE